LSISLQLKHGSLFLFLTFLYIQITRVFKAKEHAEIEFTVGYFSCYLIGRAKWLFHFNYSAQKHWRCCIL